MTRPKSLDWTRSRPLRALTQVQCRDQRNYLLVISRFIQVHPEWNIFQKFVVTQFQRALEVDATENTRPMTFYVESPEAVRNLFDDIAYSKCKSFFEDFRAGNISWPYFNSGICAAYVFARLHRSKLQKRTYLLFECQVIESGAAHSHFTNNNFDHFLSENLTNQLRTICLLHSNAVSMKIKHWKSIIR